MPDNSYIQYGSFGVIVFLVGWFVLYGFPKMMDTISSSVDRFLSKIDSIENQCKEERIAIANQATEERIAIVREFRAECQAVREAARIEAEADRIARHKSVNDFTEIISRIVARGNKEP